MTIPKQFSHLKWALQLNPDLAMVIANTYGNNIRYLEYLDELIKELRDGKCSGIREKFADANRLRKFDSMLSEVEIARILIRHHKNVELLPDDFFHPAKSPDIISTDKNWAFFVEVKTLTEDETVNRMTADIENFLATQNKRNCRVDLNLKRGLTMVTTRFLERRAKEKLAMQSFQEFKDKFAQANLSNLPISLDTKGCIFEINESGLDRSYVGITRTGVFTVPLDKLVEKIRRDVVEKAKKRIDWKQDHPNIFYIVAINSEQTSVTADDVEQALIGTRVTVARWPPDSPVPIEKVRPQKLARGVKTASKKGWQPFLRELYVIPRNRTFLDINKKGIYFTKRVVKNVSRVLVRFRLGGFHWVPNPFAYDEISDPNLVDYFEA